MAEQSSYTSFYRRFRPQKFAEVLGQEHVTTALRNAVAQNRISHFYLFSGPRGTGKTSTARILAKALNCLAPIDGEPCDQCDSCVSIREGRSFDVSELDAASNNGVEAVRSLVAQTSTASFGRWKVYIIDEIHMLSTAASNALLKTLEEPPSHVVFVLATTDPQKVIPTILSRAQHYEFKFLDEATLEQLIGSIRDRAQFALEDGAVSWLLQKGAGSARDTLSYLDQVVALGYVPESRGDLDHLIEALKAEDLSRVMTSLDALLRSGHSPANLCVELISRFRTAFLRELGAPVSAEDPSGSGLTSRWLVQALTALGGALGAMRDSLDPRIMLEVALVGLLDGPAKSEISELNARIDALERDIATLKTGASPVGSNGGDTSTATSSLSEAAGSAEMAPPPQRHLSKSSQSPSGSRADGAPSQGRSKDTMDQLRSALSRGKTASMPAQSTDEVQTTSSRPPEKTESSTRKAGGDSGGYARANSADPEPDSGGKPSAEGHKVGAANDSKECNDIFRKSILVSLSPRARSLFSAARVITSEEDLVVMSVPNEAHKVHAYPNLKDVQEAFRGHFSNSKLVLQLTSDEIAGQRPGTMPEAEAEAGADLIEQFSSAPEAMGGAETQILEVFPGAKRIES